MQVHYQMRYVRSETDHYYTGLGLFCHLPYSGEFFPPWSVGCIFDRYSCAGQFFSDLVSSLEVSFCPCFLSLCEFLFDPFCDLRSEEHTSELQSRGHLVCRLLLEKNKLINHVKKT